MRISKGFYGVLDKNIENIGNTNNPGLPGLFWQALMRPYGIAVAMGRRKEAEAVTCSACGNRLNPWACPGCGAIGEVEDAVDYLVAFRCENPRCAVRCFVLEPA